MSARCVFTGGDDFFGVQAEVVREGITAELPGQVPGLISVREVTRCG